MDRVGRHLKGDLVPTLSPRAGTPSTRPGGSYQQPPSFVLSEQTTCQNVKVQLVPVHRNASIHVWAWHRVLCAVRCLLNQFQLFLAPRSRVEVMFLAVFAVDPGWCLLRAAQKCQCKEIMRQGNIPLDVVI